MNFKSWIENSVALGDVQPSEKEIDSSEIKRMIADLVIRDKNKLINLFTVMSKKGLLDNDPDFKYKVEKLTSCMQQMKFHPKEKKFEPDHMNNVVVRSQADSSSSDHSQTD